MSAAKKGLGRGFESLIPTDLIDDSFDPNSTYDPTRSEDKQVSDLGVLPLAAIRANPDQPRQTFDQTALDELAASIKEHGVLQPIIVVPVEAKDGVYEIVAGERRYRAAKQAGLSEIPVIIRTMTGQHQLEVSLIENIQRRDLNVIETATAYSKLRAQFNLSNEQIAQRVHKSPSAVANTMRLLKLPPAALKAIAEGQLSEGQARPLVGLDSSLIEDILPRMISESWTARRVEQYVARTKQPASTDHTGTQMGTIAALAAAEQQHRQRIKALGTRLATKVDIRINSKGAGKLTIDFKSLEELERIERTLDK